MGVSDLVLKNASFLFVSDIVTRLLSFALFLVIARALGTSGLGDYSFIFAFSGLFIVLNDVGLATLFVREVSRDLEKTSYFFRNVLSMKLIFSTIAAAITILAINFTNVSSEVRLSVYVVALATFFFSLKDLFLAVFQAHQKMWFIAIARVLETFLIVTLGMFALFSGYGILGLTFAFLTSYFFVLVVSAFAATKLTDISFGMDFDFQKKFLKNSWPFWFTGIFLAIYFRIDTVMIGLMRGSIETGLYNASYRLLDALYFIPAAVIAAVFPAMSKLHTTSKAALQMLYKKAFYYLFTIALPMGIGATLLADRLLFFIYGNEFAGASIALKVLIWAEVAIFLSSITGYLLNSINKQLLFTFTTAVAAVLNIIMNFFFIKSWGFMGAAVSTVITEFFVLLVLFYFVRKNNYKFNVLKISIKPVIAAGAMTVAIFSLLQFHIILIVIASGAVYFAVLALTKGIEKEEVDLAKTYMKRFF
jgi:O-antigen/teichoic acid export membrane protein